ncbi:MAG: alpha/beta hydrolase, partial [Eudoraea sp.]|nr:alpha/beta hydrolase [Eudoraea sp.]
GLYAQEETIVIKKGIVQDSIQVRDSISETFAIYVPKSFDNSRDWPVLFVMDLEGKGKEALHKFKNAAEKQQYILAASNNLRDTLNISENVLVTNRLINSVIALLPVHKERLYTTGFGAGARMASIIPVFIKQISGVVSIGAAFPNYELLYNKIRFQFVGVVGREDYNFTSMWKGRSRLNGLKIPNDLIVHDGGYDWPNPLLVEKAVERLSLAALKDSLMPSDSIRINRAYLRDYEQVEEQIQARRLLEAVGMLNSMHSAYRDLVNIDSLVKKRRSLRKSKIYKAQLRELNNLMFKENLIQGEYEFSLLQDLDNLNYNNLGWWNYQMKELQKYEEKPSFREKQLGRRLAGYLNALVEDNLDIEQARSDMDEEAISLLWMIKTITDPSDHSYYLKIISDSARYEDFGTAIFYLEELLKQGYTDKEAIYALEHTALLRITPEFNKLIDKYLDAPRYKLNEQ